MITQLVNEIEIPVHFAAADAVGDTNGVIDRTAVGDSPAKTKAVSSTLLPFGHRRNPENPAMERVCKASLGRRYPDRA